MFGNVDVNVLGGVEIVFVWVIFREIGFSFGLLNLILKLFLCILCMLIFDINLVKVLFLLLFIIFLFKYDMICKVKRCFVICVNMWLVYGMKWLVGIVGSKEFGCLCIIWWLSLDFKLVCFLIFECVVVVLKV